MKKAYLALIITVAAAVSGCTPLDRVNPTDPKAGNYVGMHYMGSIGDFALLEDFTVLGSDIWCADSVNNRIYKYTINGDLDFSFTGGGLTSPTGIGNDGTFFYAADSDTIFRNLKRFDPAYVSNTAQAQLPNYSSIYSFVKCAASTAYVFAATTTAVYRFDSIANSLTAAVSTYPFTNITDVKYNSALNEVVVADDGANNKRIVRLDANLVYGGNKIDFIEDIYGFGIKGNYIFVPTATGIHQLYYDTGVEIKKFADYGEGSGKIISAGTCDTYNDEVLVGTGSTIKCFGP